MFGLFKPKPAPDGPVIFEFDIEIDKPVEHVYALIDWADERNAKRTLGSEVRALEGATGAFQMAWTEADDLLFEMTVTHEEPHSRYAYNIVIKPQVGRMVAGHEDYAFERISDTSCRLMLVNTVEFEPGMTMREFEREVAFMGHACQQSLVKLKLHAENGAELAAQLEGKILVSGCED